MKQNGVKKIYSKVQGIFVFVELCETVQ